MADIGRGCLTRLRGRATHGPWAHDMKLAEATGAWFGGALASAVVALGGGCSPGASPLPAEGDCVSTSQATCSVSHSVGVGPGDGGGDAIACAVNSAQSQCDQCAFGNCCEQVSACLSSGSCTNLYNCTEACVDVPACLTSCRDLYPDAVVALQTIESCVTIDCAVCDDLGVGDPCGAGALCMIGLTCGGFWCTKACQTASDCAGIGPNGGNRATGIPNACIATSGGLACAPGCAADADCVLYPGTFCEATTAADGSAVSISEALPDGG